MKKIFLIQFFIGTSFLLGLPHDSHAAYANVAACTAAGGTTYDDLLGNCGCKVVKSISISNGTQITTTCETITGFSCMSPA
ncbi:MAG: hypothetical protein LBD50_02735 [Rickettsiales bacterium]|nr:hypothetical protein [Rickettsiales bacterium]